MKIDQYDVYLTNGVMKSFNEPSVTHAWIRGMSYATVTKTNAEVKHIINHATMQIYSDFQWDISFSLKDTALTTVEPVTYTEQEVTALFTDYVKYIGAASPLHVLAWFNRNKKRIANEHN